VSIPRPDDAGTPLAETLGIAEILLGKWKRQFGQQGDDAFPGNGKQWGESAWKAGKGTNLFTIATRFLTWRAIKGKA